MNHLHMDLDQAEATISSNNTQYKGVKSASSQGQPIKFKYKGARYLRPYKGNG